MPERAPFSCPATAQVPSGFLHGYVVTNMKSLHRSYRQIRRMVHVLQGNDIWQGVQQKCAQLALGNEGAAWCLCPEGLSASSVIYCAGVGEDISFDLELVRRFGVHVHAFDPTPRVIQWVQSQTLPQEFAFHPYGVADFDGTCKFLPPKNPRHVSHSLLPRETPWSAIQVPVYRLATITGMLGHAGIDLLKMDVEGAEYGVIADLLTCGIRPGQILVEFHHRWPEVGLEKTHRAIQALNAAGYRIFHVSTSGEEYSFKLNL
jgi:FkbM family methyltransferase